jgi:hypothetical protein
MQTNSFGSKHPLLASAASLAIVAHLGIVLVHALAAPSGPWPGPDGPGMAAPPTFVVALDSSSQGYLKAIRLTGDGHFVGNRPGNPGVFLEVKLKDAEGNLLSTVRFPDDPEKSWNPLAVYADWRLRRLQEIFATGFVPDQPINPLEGEAVPAPHQNIKTVPIWDEPSNQSLALRRVPEHLIPRNRPVMGPTEWSLILARSCCRYLCRHYHAASAEIVRHSRDIVPPTVLASEKLPPAAFSDLLASYGVMTGE